MESTEDDSERRVPLLRSNPRRLLDRDGPARQSRGLWSISMQRERDNRRQLKKLWDYWFYTLAYQRTIVMMIILFCLYAFLVVLYALLYFSVARTGATTISQPDGSQVIEPFCDMDIDTFVEALYMSLSTMNSIGYGVSNYYLGSCYTPFLLILSQVCCAITFDAVAIGLLFQRISRGHKRAKTVLLSAKATMQLQNRQWYLMFRVAEVWQPLLEANVHAYCVYHERIRVENSVHTTYYMTKPMRLSQERVLMSLPQVIVHSLDETSPLRPRQVWVDAEGNEHHFDVSEDTSLLQDFWKDREMEIVVLVEGTDDILGTSIETRHSYTMDDISFHRSFVNCVEPSRGGKHACVVDFLRFHETQACAPNAPSPYI